MTREELFTQVKSTFKCLDGWDVTWDQEGSGRVIINSDANQALVCAVPEHADGDVLQYFVHELLHVSLEAVRRDPQLEEQFVLDTTKWIMG